MKKIEFINNYKNENIKFINSVNGNNEIEIIGNIGVSWFDNGYTFNKFKEDLNKINGKIIINIMSMGGDLFEALAIYDHIRSLKNKVVTKIIGSTASAGTIISLAGDRRYITPNSRYLIHKPMVHLIGNSDDFEDVLKQLKDLDKQIVDLYSKRTKLTAKEIIKLMGEEKFISSEEAIEKGFIDDYVKDKDYANIVDAEIPQININIINDDNMETKINIDEEKIENTLINHLATNEINNTIIVAKQENASEIVVNEVNVEIEEKVVVDEVEKEDDKNTKLINELNETITTLRTKLKEIEEKEVENKLQNFKNFLDVATQKGKISLNSHMDWLNVFKKDGETIAYNLLNNIPEKQNTVDAVINKINSNTDTNLNIKNILNDWKSGKIDGIQAEQLLNQIKK